MKLTENFDLKEFERSETATKYGIDNSIPLNLMENVKELANVLQIIRDYWQSPIKINSGFRSPELNKKVGGAKTSQHMKGEAADLSAGNHKDNWKLGKLIQSLIERKIITCGLLIFEKSNKIDKASWIHYSLGTKNQILYT